MLKKLALASAIAGLFTVGSAQAGVMLNLEQWDQNIGVGGSVNANGTTALITATASISANVVGVEGFDWKFFDNDYHPFDDFGWYSLNGGPQVVISSVNSCGLGGAGQDTPSTPQEVCAGHVDISYFTGLLTIGVNNALDSALDSQLEISNVSVPEPATLALLGLGLAGFAFSRRK